MWGVLWLFVGLGCGGKDARSAPPGRHAPAACRLSASDGTVDVAVDPCAVACASAAEGIACCLASHGRGAPAEVTALTDGCSVPATFDPSEFISRDTARCAAEVYGLVPAPGPGGVVLQVCVGRAAWNVRVYGPRGPCGGGADTLYSLRAVDGTFEAAAEEHVDTLCLPPGAAGR